VWSVLEPWARPSDPPDRNPVNPIPPEPHSLIMSLFSRDRVLVPTDFSAPAHWVVENARTLVAEPSHLHVLHVLPHLNPGEPGVRWQTINNSTRTAHIHQEFQRRYGDPVYGGVVFQVAIGDPCQQITTYAKAQAITLIVIPSHGRKGLSHFFLGSVAERVTRLAPCPVLIIKR
jgi:nucleotide-binding universal stress UspA family protein